VTSTSAELNGSVNPNGPASQAVFEWGTTTALGNVTPVINVPAGNAGVSVTAPLTGLSPNTTYLFRLRASNADNVNPQYGVVRKFTTPP
jgi:phosphodiesterase/alkaline phosphatase D-like protein